RARPRHMFSELRRSASTSTSVGVPQQGISISIMARSLGEGRATLSVTMIRMPRVTLDLPAIEVTDLRKRYGPVDALAGLTMTVGRGEVFGFLGPNGAGKT